MSLDANIHTYGHHEVQSCRHHTGLLRLGSDDPRRIDFILPTWPKKSMTKHSKNNTASSIFSYAEYKKLDYGTKRVSFLHSCRVVFPLDSSLLDTAIFQHDDPHLGIHVALKYYQTHPGLVLGQIHFQCEETDEL